VIAPIYLYPQAPSRTRAPYLSLSTALRMHPTPGSHPVPLSVCLTFRSEMGRVPWAICTKEQLHDALRGLPCYILGHLLSTYAIRIDAIYVSTNQRD
jgi:hypothetical protein